MTRWNHCLPIVLVASLVAVPAPGQPCPADVTDLLDTTNFLTMPFEAALDVRFEDFDLDGDQDIAYFRFANTGAVNSGTVVAGFFRNTIRECEASPTCDLNDFDAADYFADADTLWLDAAITQTDFANFYDVVFFDVDHDGDKDMVYGNNGKDRIFEWDGGKFQPPIDVLGDETSDYRMCGASLCTSRQTTGLAYGDVDRDGDYDLVATYRASRTRLFLNDGSGDLSQSPFTSERVFPDPDGDAGAPFPGNGNRDVYLTDLDHDGDLDAVIARSVATWGSPPGATSAYDLSALVYRYDGCQCADGSPGPYCFWYDLRDEDGDPSTGTSTTIEIVDIDGDGDYDLLQPVFTVASGHKKDTRIYLNDGTGLLGTATHAPNTHVGGNTRAWIAQTGDLDGDGDYDVAIGHDVTDRIWLNQGVVSGLPTFTEATQSIPSIVTGSDLTRYIRFTDIDLDGDPDYLEANFKAGADSRIFFNQWSDGQVPP